jgi:hypothetical protein
MTGALRVSWQACRSANAIASGLSGRNWLHRPTGVTRGSTMLIGGPAERRACGALQGVVQRRKARRTETYPHISLRRTESADVTSVVPVKFWPG